MIETLLPAGSGWVARVRCSDRDDGDFRIDGNAAELQRVRHPCCPDRGRGLRQVHGSNVVAVSEPGQGVGVEADGAVTAIDGVVLAVQTADCAPVVIAGRGVVGVAHVGWRGIGAGVIQSVVKTMAAAGSGGLQDIEPSARALLGPVIRPANYEFGASELDEVASVAGDAVRATTADGLPALDLATAVRRCLAAAGSTKLKI